MGPFFKFLKKLRADRPVSSSKNNFIYKRSDSGSKRTLIVFIHGVLGDSENTWTSSNGAYWPDLVVTDPSLSGVEALSVGFATNPIQSSSNIEEISIRLGQQLMDEGCFDEYEGIGFVCHSMGGIIAKRMIRFLAESLEEKAERIKLVVFFATPTQGSSLAEIAAWISGNPQFKDMRPSDVNTFLQMVDNDWMSMMRNRAIRKFNPRVACAYETIPMGGFHIVPRSASQNVGDIAPIAFDLNHATIVKPESHRDQLHRFLKARIKESFPECTNQNNEISIGARRSTGELSDRYRSGESYFLTVETSRPSWLYVFHRDSAGIFSRYFPSTTGGTQQAPSMTFRIPTDPNSGIILDDVVGEEEFTVLLLDIRDDNIASCGIELGFDAQSDRTAEINNTRRGGSVARFALTPESLLEHYKKSAVHFKFIHD